MARILTPEVLEFLKPGIFAEGLGTDSHESINMTGSGKPLRWVAVRGGAPDWAIYAHFSYKSSEEVARVGDKVFGKETIRQLVPCTDEALAMYRR
jgi:hypothetical protein